MLGNNFLFIKHIIILHFLVLKEWRKTKKGHKKFESLCIEVFRVTIHRLWRTVMVAVNHFIFIQCDAKWNLESDDFPTLVYLYYSYH